MRNPRAGVLNIGLTGNIGSGKSSVARLLAQRGAAVIDSDALAREATEDPRVLRQIGEDLGEDLIAGGRLDRARTAERVFSDEQARKQLEAIVHPWIRARSRSLQELYTSQDDPPPVILHDIPLLYENDLADSFDAVVVVHAPLEVRARRAEEGGRLTPQALRSRDAAQMPSEEKAELADYVLDNSGDEPRLEAQVDELWKMLTEE